MSLKVLSTDVIFTVSHDAGSECLCFRCLLPIISQLPIRVFPVSKNYEFRYHPKCLGIETYDDSDWGENYENLPY